jgi:dCTP deaminase
VTLLNDKQIAKLAENDIFMPFVGEKKRTLDDGTKAISYGLSQAGYDIRLSADHFLVVDGKAVKGTNKGELDAKLFNNSIPYEAPLIHSNSGEYFRLPPHSYGMGISYELISMPDYIMGICDGKSTYARCGIIINVTPIEPGWTGYLTISISNPTAFPARIYANEGIVQVMLMEIEEVGQAYTGNYQNQGANVQVAAV